VKKLIHSSKQFVKGFVPPDYLLDGVLQRRFIYSLTGKTGSGKSALTLLLAALVASNKSLNERDLEFGRVLYLAGENPDDIQMRWIAMGDHMEFDVDDIEVHWVVGRGSLTDVIDRITEEVEALDGVCLIIVDTSVAFFEGADENSNTEALAHALRLRGLTELAGGPCVIVNCHPVKNAADDNLLPRGGGSFLNEMDGNLTAVKIDDTTVKLHWQGKFRGPEPDPIMFGLERVTTDSLKDSKGRLIPTVIAKALSDSEARERRESLHSNEDMVLAAMLAHENASIADIAKACGWKFKGGTPDKSKVQRAFKGLEGKKLIEKLHDSYVLTAKGKKAAKMSDTADDD
jgi:energy-coupling factor transporter ATP-binding protein EcfA2